MALSVGVGASGEKDPAKAISQAYTQAVEPLGGSAPSLILCFASATTYPQEQLVAALKEKAQASARIGCSTSGEITTFGSTDHSVALMAIHSDSMKFVCGAGHNIAADAREAGRTMARDIEQKGAGKPGACLMLPDGLAGNGADIVRGVLDVFGADFRLAGGSAGDDYEFKKTYQYFGDTVFSGSVVGVGMYGTFSYGIGVRHGWVPIGNPRIATKSKGNILYELDSKPAIQMYEERFGEQTIVSTTEPFAKMAITYPLGIIAPNKDGFLIRDPITVDAQGAITCAAEIPEGAEVYLMIGGQSEAIEAAKDAATQALTQLGNKPAKAAFLFNCIARKKLLMQKKQQEIEKIQDIIGRDVPLIGFYTYGEQAPLGSEIVTCSFHNETDVLFLLGE